MFPTRIYLSGGGICGVAHVGALMELSRDIPLTGVKEWMGVSAGALMAMCLTIGFTLDELYLFSTRFDFTNILQPDTPTGWLIHMGYDTGERLQRLVHACLHVKGLPTDLTFQSLYERTGLSLRVLATDLTMGNGVVFSPKDTPDYPIGIAVSASMSIPYFFQSILCPQTGHSLIDGGIISNYPMYIVNKEEHGRTLSLLLRVGIQEAEQLSDFSPEHLLVRPLSLALTEKTNREVSLYNIECIRIPLDNISILDFSLSEEKKQELVEKGREAVRTWRTTRPKPVRRKSI